ncbi:MAG: DUF1569 domain-containing protein [Deltaproteobacteria bacterium]|nr:DUF1569 domain-containing protein [Deltaproteobacteria bacterium]
MIKLTSFAEVLAQLAITPSMPGLGAALSHCAQSIEYSLTGFPTQRGFLVRKLVGPFILRKFLRQGSMSHDLKAPIPGAPEIPPALPLSDGLARLKRAIEQFRNHSGALAPHFAFGDMSRQDYERLHAMHLADHLSSFP